LRVVLRRLLCPWLLDFDDGGVTIYSALDVECAVAGADCPLLIALILAGGNERSISASSSNSFLKFLRSISRSLIV